MNALAQEIRQAVREEFLSLMKETQLQERRLKRIPEAAKYLTVSPRTLQEMIQHGEIPIVRRERLTMLDVQDLDRWIEDHKE